ncbi:MAG: hypothetical protein GC156_11705 [Actinomycetales bacterium]|nr:hypothetical protein [Actinomycetales bacterium]
MTSVMLGTAQWGLDYGVTNTSGRLTDEAITETLAVAAPLGIAALDTAPGYGDAEERIGHLAQGFLVQTKVAAAGASATDLERSLEASTRRLGRRVSRLLVHDWPALGESERTRVAGVLESARERGEVDLVGISGYEEADLLTALDAFRHLDVAQMPASVLDQRLASSVAVRALRASGGLLQARSIYVQGVALADPRLVPRAAHPAVQALRQAANAHGTSPQVLCVAFVRATPWIDELVVGVTSALELERWAAAWAANVDADWSALATEDVDLIDPRRWSS